MKNTVLLSNGENYTAINVGSLNELIDYSFLHPKFNREVTGKVFLREALQSTGVEMSLTILPPHSEMPFYHKHNKHEEIYFFIKGSGQYQIDQSIFDVKEGSFVRVAPEGVRTWRNNSDEPLIFMVIQSIANSIALHNIEDGSRIKGEVTW